MGGQTEDDALQTSKRRTSEGTGIQKNFYNLYYKTFFRNSRMHKLQLNFDAGFGPVN